MLSALRPFLHRTFNCCTHRFHFTFCVRTYRRPVHYSVAKVSGNQVKVRVIDELACSAVIIKQDIKTRRIKLGFDRQPLRELPGML